MSQGYLGALFKHPEHPQLNGNLTLGGRWSLQGTSKEPEDGNAEGMEGRWLLTVWRHPKTSKSNPSSTAKRETKRYLAKDIKCSEEI